MTQTLQQAAAAKSEALLQVLPSTGGLEGENTRIGLFHGGCGGRHTQEGTPGTIFIYI